MIGARYSPGEGKAHAYDKTCYQQRGERRGLFLVFTSVRYASRSIRWLLLCLFAVAGFAAWRIAVKAVAINAQYRKTLRDYPPSKMQRHDPRFVKRTESARLR
jgi:hypothetical protein